MKFYRFKIIGLISVLFFISGIMFCFADESKFKGWEIDSEYHQLYDPDAVEKIKVYVKKVEEKVPGPDMAKGVILEVEDAEEGELYTVHVCPVAYKSKRALGISKRDKLSLRGCFVDFGDDEIIMASKIKIEKKKKTIKVRLTSNGKPFWSMDQEELKKELSQTE